MWKEAERCRHISMITRNKFTMKVIRIRTLATARTVPEAALLMGC